MVRLRKPHPCGGYDWQVTRLGADIGLRCLTCNRRVLLDRATLEKRTKELIFRARIAAEIADEPHPAASETARTPEAPS